MTEETQALVAFAGTWVCHHFNPESGADCRELHKGDHDMWCSSCIVLDLAAALTALARDLETARQERDTARDKLKLALATSDLTDADLTRTVEKIAERMGRAMEAECRRQIEAAEASRDAAVRAARHETWAEAALLAGQSAAAIRHMRQAFVASPVMGELAVVRAEALEQFAKGLHERATAAREGQ